MSLIIVHEVVINNTNLLHSIHMQDDAVNTACIPFSVEEGGSDAIRMLSIGTHGGHEVAIADATLLDIIALRARLEETKVLYKVRDALPLIIYRIISKSFVLFILEIVRRNEVRSKVRIAVGLTLL